MQASWWIENMQYRWCTTHKRDKTEAKKGKCFTYQAWWTCDLCQETCSRCNSLSCSSLVCTSPARRFPGVRWTSCHLSSVATYLVLPHLTVEGKSVFDVASPLGLVTTDGQTQWKWKLGVNHIETDCQHIVVEIANLVTPSCTLNIMIK